MKRVYYTKPFKQLDPKDLDDSFIRIENWDPYFWEKTTHVVCTSFWEGNIFCSKFEYYMKPGEILGQLSAGKGYVYILTSDQQEGLCKIGYTERTPEERLREINAGTGVIFPWKLYDAFPCRTPRAVEQLVHKALSEVRIDQKKEGFAVYPKVARDIIVKVINDSREEFYLDETELT